VDSAFHENESKFAGGVLSVLLQVLSDGNSLLDQSIQILGDLWCTTSFLEDS